MNCGSCDDKACYQGKDCFKLADKMKKIELSPETLKLMKVASEIEADYYMKSTRLEELILFSQKMGYTRIGLAFCIGLSEEAGYLEKILNKRFRVFSVCCKIGGIDKKTYELPQIKCQRYEAMCNPIGQAMFLNEHKVDLNLTCGLCIGHDLLFGQNSRAPVTALIVKDRILAHNPAGALYSNYHRSTFL